MKVYISVTFDNGITNTYPISIEDVHTQEEIDESIYTLHESVYDLMTKDKASVKFEATYEYVKELVVIPIHKIVEFKIRKLD